MSLRVRIALISASAVAIAIAIAALVTYHTTKTQLLDEVDASLHDRLAAFQEIEDLSRVEDLFELGRALGLGSRAYGPFSRGDSGFDAIFFQYWPTDAPGALTDYTLEEGGLPIGEPEQAVYNGTVEWTLRTVPMKGDNLRMLTATIPTGTVQVARSLAEVDRSLDGLAAVLKFAAVVGIVLAGAVGYLVSRGAARPIGQLAEAAEHVAETQELASRIDVSRTDEVGRLAESFNKMLAALESSREQQRRLVNDAGHELRTPLTAIRTNVELLGRMDNIPADERAQMIADIESEIQELSGLVAELVNLAAAPQAGTTISEPVALADVVDRVIDKYRRRTGLRIDVSTDNSVVCGRAGDIERAVSNLIDNAVKWSPDDQPVIVTVDRGKVTVTDRGPGIDEADRPHIFNRFYRATQARSKPGSGLGLSIVAKVAEDSGGETFVEDSAIGAVVGFRLPLVDGDDDEGSQSQQTARTGRALR